MHDLDNVALGLGPEQILDINVLDPIVYSRSSDEGGGGGGSVMEQALMRLSILLVIPYVPRLTMTMSPPPPHENPKVSCKGVRFAIT